MCPRSSIENSSARPATSSRQRWKATGVTPSCISAHGGASSRGARSHQQTNAASSLGRQLPAAKHFVMEPIRPTQHRIDRRARQRLNHDPIRLGLAARQPIDRGRSPCSLLPVDRIASPDRSPPALPRGEVPCAPTLRRAMFPSRIARPSVPRRKQPCGSSSSISVPVAKLPRSACVVPMRSRSWAMIDCMIGIVK